MSTSRKRRSAPATPTESPAGVGAKRRATQGSEATAAADDPPTLVPVPGKWSEPMLPAREAGELIDVTLVSGRKKIPAHKLVIISHSPYLHGLLTSGFAESTHAGGAELKISTDEGDDGRAVEAIVDCFYTGKLALSKGTVSSVIRTADLFRVGAVEKAACDFFVDSIQPPTACEALAFASAYAAGGEHGRALHKRCVDYVVERFAQCSVESSFVELQSEAVAEVIASDDLPVAEPTVLAAVRVWFDHDPARRAASLKTLLPLVRWPLLPAEVQLNLPKEPLLHTMMEQDRQALALGMELLTECQAAFWKSDAAPACRRLKRRKGAVRPLCFTKMSQGYTTGEDGALLTVSPHAGDSWRVALCHETVMDSGLSCAEFTMVEYNDDEANIYMLGVGRPTLDVNISVASNYLKNSWGIVSCDGDVGQAHRYAADGTFWHKWPRQQPYGQGDTLRLLLDSDAGTLTVKKNGSLLGVAVTRGLTGPLCWAVLGGDEGISVRIKAVDPAEF